MQVIFARDGLQGVDGVRVMSKDETLRYVTELINQQRHDQVSLSALPRRKGCTKSEEL